MTPVEVIQGSGPVVLGMPHTGTHVPEDVFKRLTPLGKTLGDTDWHIDRLYEGLLKDVTIVRANFHRYVIDANRDPSGASLYPGQNTTGLVPITDFDGEPLWITEPDAGEIEARRKAWHEPYHAALAAELARVRELHDVAILYDCHSIRSVIPFLFEGVLPDFNIGTNESRTCASEIEQAVAETCHAAEGYSAVVNGRFKGGWTTRYYGQPQNGIHAIQMELAQKTHLGTETVPFEYDTQKAAELRVHLKAILERLEALAPKLARPTGEKS